MIDPNEVSDEILRLSPEELADKMGIVYRTVYKHINKNNWPRIEGFQGTVEYDVPKSYIVEYLENKKKKADKGTVIGPSLNVERSDIRPVRDYENERLKNDEINTDIIQSLSVEISEASRTQRETYERLLKEIDAKYEAEKKLLQQSTQLANLNAERVSFTTAIEKRQDDKRRIERLEKELEELKAELEKAKTPWWKKLT